MSMFYPMKLHCKKCCSLQFAVSNILRDSTVFNVEIMVRVRIKIGEGVWGMVRVRGLDGGRVKVRIRMGIGVWLWLGSGWG